MKDFLSHLLSESIERLWIIEIRFKGKRCAGYCCGDGGKTTSPSCFSFFLLPALNLKNTTPILLYGTQQCCHITLIWWWLRRGGGCLFISASLLIFFLWVPVSPFTIVTHRENLCVFFCLIPCLFGWPSVLWRPNIKAGSRDGHF